MTKRRVHHHTYFTIGICLCVYALVFCIANADVLKKAFSSPPLVTTTQKITIMEPEAQFDEDYFNSPQVNRAMSLNNPSPNEYGAGISTRTSASI